MALIPTPQTPFLNPDGSVNRVWWLYLRAVAAGVTIFTVPQGGTGSATFTARGILLGEGVNAIAATAAMTDGQVLVGQTGADPLPKTLSGDATLAASGALTLASVATAGTNTKITFNAKGLVTAAAAAALASADFANQGTTVTVLHGNAAGNPSFGAVSLTADVSGTLPVASGGTGVTTSTGTGSVVLSVSPTLTGTLTAAALTVTGLLTLTPAPSMLSTGAAPTIGEATLGAGGTVTVSTTAATATAKIFFQRKTAGGTIGFATTYTISAGVSFTLSSDNALDRSVYEWVIFEAR